MSESLTVSILESLGWTLLHFCWQCVLWSAIAWTILRVLPASWVRGRYLTALSFFFAMTLFVPLTFQQQWQRQASLPTSEFLPAGVEGTATSVLLPTNNSSNATTVAKPIRSSSPTRDTGDSRALSEWQLPTLPASRRLLSAFSIIWIAGVLVLNLRLLMGVLRIRKWQNQSRALPQHLEQLTGRLVERWGIRGDIRFRTTNVVTVPLVFGWLKPTVLLPTSLLTGLTTTELEYIVAHELAHIRRYDYPINFLQNLIETIFFFHPCVWWLSSVIRQERENCCDDLAAQLKGSRLQLAKALLRLEEIRGQSLALSAAQSPLKARITRLVLPQATVSPLPVFAILSTLTLTLVFASLSLPTSWAAKQELLPTTDPNEASGKAIEASQPGTSSDATTFDHSHSRAAEAPPMTPSDEIATETLGMAPATSETGQVAGADSLEVSQLTLSHFNLPQRPGLQLQICGKSKILKQQDQHTQFEVSDGEVHLISATDEYLATAKTKLAKMTVDCRLKENQIVSIEFRAVANDPKASASDSQIQILKRTDLNVPLRPEARPSVATPTLTLSLVASTEQQKPDSADAPKWEFQTHLQTLPLDDHPAARAGEKPITLEVLNSQGQPASQLQVFSRSEGPGSAKLIGVTDDRGRLLLSDIETGDHFYIAGHEQGFQSIHIREAYRRQILDHNRMRVILLPPSAMIYHVLLPDGTPASEGRVQLLTFPNPRNHYLLPYDRQVGSWGPVEPISEVTARNIDQGFVIFKSFPDWLVRSERVYNRVRVEVPGYGSQEFQADQQEIQLKEVGILRLSIPESEVPIQAGPHGYVRYGRENSYLTGVPFTFSKSGIAEVFVAANQSISLDIRVWDSQLQKARIPSLRQLSPGETQEVKISPPATQILQVHVSDHATGKSVADAGLEVVAGNVRLFGPEYRTDANGNWSKRLPAGATRVKVYTRSLNYESHEPIEIELESGKMEACQLNIPLTPKPPSSDNAGEITPTSEMERIQTTEIGQQSRDSSKLSSTVRSWDFGEADDINHDDFPDDWRRQTGDGFPRYNRGQVTKDTSHSENAVLQLTAENQAIGMISGPIRIAKTGQYQLQFNGRLSPKNMGTGKAWASLIDEHGQSISGLQPIELTSGDTWKTSQSSPLTLKSSSATIHIGLFAESTEAKRTRFSVQFDDVALKKID